MKKPFRKAAAAVMAAAMCGSLAGLTPVSAAGKPLGTYECETMEGVDQVWTSIYENQIPGYSGEGFAYLTSAPLSIDIEIDEEGMYQVDVRAAQILSEEGRMQTISINGIDYTYNMPYLDKWTEMVCILPSSDRICAARTSIWYSPSFSTSISIETGDAVRYRKPSPE